MAKIVVRLYSLDFTHYLPASIPLLSFFLGVRQGKQGPHSRTISLRLTQLTVRCFAMCCRIAITSSHYTPGSITRHCPYVGLSRNYRLSMESLSAFPTFFPLPEAECISGSGGICKCKTVQPTVRPACVKHPCHLGPDLSEKCLVTGPSWYHVWTSAVVCLRTEATARHF